ncbi:MAG: aldehyde dehydrogenase family protein [Gemmatimonadaceae bacterium]|jgi:aldehyde dehydrogenase (NAD+)|nr:aldehyde dehydrogenase family protein [Gemmatimonadaceae bacterium]
MTTESCYIDGAWHAPQIPVAHPVIDPSTGDLVDHWALGGLADVERAVRAARAAWPAWAATPLDERLAVLERIITQLVAHEPALADAVTRDIGAPVRLARGAQAPAAATHARVARAAAEAFPWRTTRGRAAIEYEPIGVCALITPWNWPLNQIACKVAPALAAGCTVILKPSEMAPLSAHRFAEALHAADVPRGVFNLVTGTGPVAGEALARHPDVDLVSFTGSTRAGAAVAHAAADRIARVTQELGGKSANLVLDDADLTRAVTQGVRAVLQNSGQSCNAPTRLLVPRHKLADAEEIARSVVDATVVGDPRDERTHMGPVASLAQFERVQGYLALGGQEGARLVTGGAGRPAHLEGTACAGGAFVQPTVFSQVHNGMRIAREEIFGPVLCLLPYDTEDEAVAIANDSPYGLAAYVQSSDAERALRVARRLRAGNVHLNGAPVDYAAPFGGYKQSGNGREWGEEGLREYLEVKAILRPASAR